VVACVVLQPGAPACNEAALRAFAKERLAGYKVPKDVLFLTALPKNALGKVMKPELLAQVRATVPIA
jgi:malonyl-CoA/methylmalonyl-CoA synthetase